MTTYYVGPGGSDVAAGTSWGARFLTLSKAATSVAAGDTVRVGPGAYRETLTISVSGTLGNVISWVGDYLGTLTDGVGGVVRITGSDNDQTFIRIFCITATTKNYNTFDGFLLESSPSYSITDCTNFTLQRSVLSGTSTVVSIAGASQANCSIQNCMISNGTNSVPITFTHTANVDNAGHTIQNCIVLALGAPGAAIASSKVGGIVMKNSMVMGGTGFRITGALTAGQTVTINNCNFWSCNEGLRAVNVGEIIEDYNNFHGCNSARANVNVGANSKSYLLSPDARWFFQLAFAGAGPNSSAQVVSPFDLASYSALVNLAGTSPTTTDMRGTAVQGAQREWGSLEYDSTLKIKGGGGVSRARVVNGA